MFALLYVLFSFLIKTFIVYLNFKKKKLQKIFVCVPVWAADVDVLAGLAAGAALAGAAAGLPAALAGAALAAAGAGAGAVFFGAIYIGKYCKIYISKWEFFK